MENRYDEICCGAKKSGTVRRGNDYGIHSLDERLKLVPNYM